MLTGSGTNTENWDLHTSEDYDCGLTGCKKIYSSAESYSHFGSICCLVLERPFYAEDTRQRCLPKNFTNLTCCLASHPRMSYSARLTPNEPQVWTFVVNSNFQLKWCFGPVTGC